MWILIRLLLVWSTLFATMTSRGHTAEYIVVLCSFNRLFRIKTYLILSCLGLHRFPLSSGVEILDIIVLMQIVYARIRPIRHNIKPGMEYWCGAIEWSSVRVLQFYIMPCYKSHLYKNIQ